MCAIWYHWVFQTFDNPIDSQNQVPKIENDDTSQDLISIPSILARMAKNWQAEGTEKGYHVDEDDDEYQEYFAGMPPIEMSHSELLLFMEKTLSKGLSANSPLSRVKISKKKQEKSKSTCGWTEPETFTRLPFFSTKQSFSRHGSGRAGLPSSRNFCQA